MDIKVARRSMDRFKRIARRRYPLEYLEILIGRVSEGAIEIVKSVPIPHTASVSSNGGASSFADAGLDLSCDWEDADLEIIKLKAEKEGLVFLGTIHSHPGSPNTPSDTDNESVLSTRERVFGIYSFDKNAKSGRCTASKLCFYLPQVAVPIQTS